MIEKRTHVVLGGADANAPADKPADKKPAESPVRPLHPAAQRALAEAAARRAEQDRKAQDQPRELNGRDGLDPARYGDWEVKGIACDF